MILPLALPTAPTTPRALWVWEGSRSLVTDASVQTRFFAFLDSPRGDKTKPIKTVFFGAVTKKDLTDSTVQVLIRKFIESAHQLGVRIDYLVGGSHWAEPSGRPEALDQLRAVLVFNRTSKPAERFDGFQYDVEPYLLKSWPAKETVASFLALFDEANALIRKDGGTLILGAAIPRWFDSPSLNGLHESVADRTDYLAIMDYVDNAKAFVEDGRAEVAYATKAGKKVWLGAETQRLSDEPRATFFAAGERTMEDAFTAASNVYRTQRGFAGLAIHYYDSYQSLRP